ncbi:MAG: hypothetical protein AAFX99_34795, partial [Myxococcota bacterium]
MMMEPTPFKLRPVELIAPLGLFTLGALACVGGELTSMDGFEAVDEDFSRSSPELAARGALSVGCDDSTAEEGDPLYQRDPVFEY